MLMIQLATVAALLEYMEACIRSYARMRVGHAAGTTHFARSIDRVEFYEGKNTLSR
jgi:hypothetical protein